MIYVVLAVAILSALILIAAPEFPAPAFVLLAALTYIGLKAKAIRRKHSELRRLHSSCEQLDQQAKRIIRTDLELNRTKESLDRKVASLLCLYKLGQQLKVSLQPAEVYARLDASLITNFGFANALLGMCPSSDIVQWGSLIGINQGTADNISAHLVDNHLIEGILTNPSPVSIGAASTDPQRRLLRLLNVPNVIIAGIIPHSGPPGCLILGRTGSRDQSAKTDAELVSILTNQLAAAVESCALYEQAWASTQTLERKVRERTHELAQANAELKRLNKAKSDFVSAVSHELRTPLAAIKGYASLLVKGQFGKLEKAQSERLSKIERHSDMLTQLINNLLDIARIESGRVAMERAPIALSEFLISVHDIIRPQLEERKINYTVERNGIEKLLGDATHLRRVFVNLLSNAIKYTPEKGSIKVIFVQEGSCVLASITDSGCGMAKEDLPNLFQEFYRSRDPINQKVRGTGLGLALVKRIVEAHHGSIWAQSDKGKGSTFTVRLPTT